MGKYVLPVSARVNARVRVLTHATQMIRTMHSDRGSAAVPFIIAFPIFLWIVGILVQYGLIVNARIMVDDAARMAARSAATCLPDQQSERISKAALMTLVPLSPMSTTSVDADGQAIASGLMAMGATIADSYAARYTYAKEATDISWDPSGTDFLRNKGQEVAVTVKYRFYLTVPGASRLIGYSDSIAGVSGRFLTLTSQCQSMTAHGRQTQTDGNGWPN